MLTGYGLRNMPPLTRIRSSFEGRPWKRLLWIACCCLLPGLCRGDLWVTGYYPGYESGAMAPSNIDLTTVTHVIHFSLVPNSDGSLDSNANNLTAAACAKLVGVAHAAGRKALVCVGGAGSETGFLGATTAANLGLFVANAANFMSAYGYDGVDLDWEPFNSADANPYTNLVNALRATLGANKLLTVAAPAYPEYGDSPTAEFAMLASVQGRFDQINIMTFDLSGPYPGWVTWYNSPIYDGGYTFPNTSELVPSINGAVSNFVNNGVVPAKLGIGLPFYGYVWTGGPGVNQPRQSWPTNSVPTAAAYTWATIVNTYYQSNLYHWDGAAQAAYLSLTNAPASDDMFISYDDTHACQAKVSFARNLRLGGIMIWELSQDYLPSQPSGRRAPLMSALKEALATPDIAGIQRSGTNIGLSFTSLPLALYRVLWSSNLAFGLWNTLTNNVPGTGTNVAITDPAPPAAPQRFYRIQTPP
jgi:chitinase